MNLRFDRAARSGLRPISARELCKSLFKSHRGPAVVTNSPSNEAPINSTYWQTHGGIASVKVARRAVKFAALRCAARRRGVHTQVRAAIALHAYQPRERTPLGHRQKVSGENTISGRRSNYRGHVETTRRNCVENGLIVNRLF